jgi:hypothetical protein
MKIRKTMKSVLLQFRITPKIAQELDNLAGAANLDRPEFLRFWIGTIARLKREYAVRAIADIPADRFKNLPGRPSDTTGYDAQP